MDGIVVPSPLPLNKKYSKNKVILYTGTLDAFSGVRELVKAFQRINEPNYRLMICGGEDNSQSADLFPQVIHGIFHRCA